MCILKADVRRFGHTDFCGGCDAAKQGVVKRHNDECRRRIEAKMLEGGATVARLKRAQKRLTEKRGKPVQAIAKAASASASEGRARGLKRARADRGRLCRTLRPKRSC